MSYFIDQYAKFKSGMFIKHNDMLDILLILDTPCAIVGKYFYPIKIIQSTYRYIEKRTEYLSQMNLEYNYHELTPLEKLKYL